MDNKTLTDKQLKFIDAYLNSKSVKETCEKLNISRNTAYINFLRNDSVTAEINKRRSELINDTTLYLQDSLKECSQMLMEIIKSPNTSPQVKISAINSIFNNCNKLTETNDILTKLAEIEQRLAEQEDKIDAN